VAPGKPRIRRKRLSAKVLAAIERSMVLGIRAGSGEHRIIGIWAVVVDGRVFVRSWTSQRGGWHATLLEEPRGVIAIDGREIRVRAVHRVSERMKDRVSLAYAAKYPTKASRKYVVGFDRPRRRATTTELVPG
jgi:hypothetical protein